MIFGLFCISFWDHFWYHFEFILGSFWDHFGIICTPGGSLGWPLGLPGEPWGVLGGSLGASWATLGIPGGSWGASRDFPGVFREIPGAILAPFWITFW